MTSFLPRTFILEVKSLILHVAKRLHDDLSSLSSFKALCHKISANTSSGHVWDNDNTVSMKEASLANIPCSLLQFFHKSPVTSQEATSMQCLRDKFPHLLPKKRWKTLKDNCELFTWVSEYDGWGLKSQQHKKFSFYISAIATVSGEQPQVRAGLGKANRADLDLQPNLLHNNIRRRRFLDGLVMYACVSEDTNRKRYKKMALF